MFNLHLLEWIIAILKGIWQGLGIGLLSFGPSFFALVNTGITSGKKTATRMALGIFLSELTVAMGVLFGLSSFFTNQYFQMAFALLAAIAIMYMGIKSYITKYSVFLANLQIKPSSSASFLKGFLVNILNPFVIMLWIGVLAAVSVGYDNTEPNYQYRLLVNMLAILGTLFSIDLGKVYLSDFLGKKISKRIFFFIQKYFGVLLMAIGIYFIYHFWHLLCQYNLV